jgi:hypothetical protein
MEIFRPVPWMAALSLVACGGTTTGGGADASVDQSSDQASSDASSDVALDGPGGPCPASPPADGSACSLSNGFQCEYGASFWAFCDEMATCANGKWQIAATQSCPYTEGSNACPAQTPTVSDTCSPEGISCGYPGVQCNCQGFCGGAFNPDAGVDWKCTTPDPNCPWPRPRFGSACPGTDAGTYCSYDICCSGSSMQCQNGYWQGSTSLGGCP